MKRILMGTTCLLLSTSFAAFAADSATTSTSLTNKEDKLSYSMGAETGKAFKKHDVSVNPQAFSQGLTDALTGNKMALSDDEMHQALQNFQKESVDKMQTQMKEQGTGNQKKADDFLAANKDKAGVITTESGLQYKVVDAGKGASPTDNDVVTVNYEGTHISGDVFDSSYKRGQPATFPVSGVIQGWQEALKLMKPGATWELYIPPGLAYGERGAPGTIGPNELLIFKVNLISVKSGDGSQAATTTTDTNG